MVTRPIAKKVKSLDELLQADGMFSIPAQREENGMTLIEFDKIRPFRNHPFHLYKDERLDDLVESIKSNGILIPMIVRKIDADPNGYEYEMLASHNRLNGAKLAGLAEGSCIVKDSISDEEALMYVIETNVIQRSFADMLPTEKAAVLAMSYSKFFLPETKTSEIEKVVEEALELYFQTHPDRKEGNTT